MELETSTIVAEPDLRSNDLCLESTVQRELQSQQTKSDNNNNNNIDGIIWTKKKPTANDLEATSLLLSTRQKMSKLFDDKKTRKAKLWNDVAKTLEDNNYKLGEKGGERCRQKFANLQKSYLAYIKHQTTTGTEKTDEVPPFFEEIHSILGGKHKVNPANLEDSMNDEGPGDIVTQAEMLDNSVQDQARDAERSELDSVTQTLQPNSSLSTPKLQDEVKTDVEDNLPSTSKGYNSQRFKKGKRKLTPSKQEEFVKELEKDRASRNKEFDFLKNHLKKSEEQRDRFLNILEHAFLPKKQKKDVSKEKQIAELGKQSRDKCSKTLISENIEIENLPPAAPAQAPSFSPIALDHDYPGGSCSSSMSNAASRKFHNKYQKLKFTSIKLGSGKGRSAAVCNICKVTLKNTSIEIHRNRCIPSPNSPQSETNSLEYSDEDDSTSYHKSSKVPRTRTTKAFQSSAANTDTTSAIYSQLGKSITGQATSREDLTDVNENFTEEILVDDVEICNIEQMDFDDVQLIDEATLQNIDLPNAASYASDSEMISYRNDHGTYCASVGQYLEVGSNNLSNQKQKVPDMFKTKAVVADTSLPTSTLISSSSKGNLFDTIEEKKSGKWTNSKKK
ncbi:unnamed protein product [Ceutorhynchus assimilis]|uniref:Myb/SANT-like DNA-binding domain-containing protein n=1 Tax=Ceutorhynchus assimilis TaxID=467358 RepID=A0A9N9QL22_9CUCU|nr:unnamed protein product [Ceutorhynchus assimilis]